MKIKGKKDVGIGLVGMGTRIGDDIINCVVWQIVTYWVRREGNHKEKKKERKQVSKWVRKNEINK